MRGAFSLGRLTTFSRALRDGFRRSFSSGQPAASTQRWSMLKTFRLPMSASLLTSTATLGAFSRPAAAASFASSAAAASATSSIIDQLAFREMGLLSWLVVDVAIQWAGWAVSSLLKTDKFFDMLGTGSFAVLALASLLTSPASHARKIAATAFAVAWAARLGAFLVYRVNKVGHDSRFDEVKHQPLRFFVFWTLQAVWVFTTLLPVLLLNSATAGGPARLLWTDIVGGAVFATGFLVEAVADGQKFVFKMDAANRGKFIESGLWKHARYPNYFGEMLVWWGMFTFCAGGLQGVQFASVVSPLFVMLLLRFVSGVPLQEKQAEARWGTTQEYQSYRARTNLLVPLPKCWQSKDA